MTSGKSSRPLTAGDVQAAVYDRLIDLGITPASAAHATARAVQALLEPSLTFELDRLYAAKAAAAKRKRPQDAPIPAPLDKSD